MIDIICGRLLICISVFLLCGGLYLYSLRRCGGKIAALLAVAFGVWSLVSIFRGLLLEELFAQLFVGGVIAGAEVTLIVSALRKKSNTPTAAEEFIDFGFDPAEEEAEDAEAAEAEEDEEDEAAEDETDEEEADVIDMLNGDEAEATLSPDNADAAYRSMDEAVVRWVSSKRYLDPEVTIINMSQEIKSNRTYLSSYINKRYGVTFRDWLTDLRIREAKDLLKDQGLSIAEVARRTGFSTGTTFSRSFMRVEKISPTAWRETNL